MLQIMNLANRLMCFLPFNVDSTIQSVTLIDDFKGGAVSHEKDAASL